DYDSHCLLSNGCLFRRAEEIDFVRDAQSQPDQTTNNGAQHHSYNCRRNGENYSVDKHCKESFKKPGVLCGLGHWLHDCTGHKRTPPDWLEVGLRAMYREFTWR